MTIDLRGSIFFFTHSTSTRLIPPIGNLRVRHLGKIVTTFVDGHGSRQTISDGLVRDFHARAV
jgi:hypothetical protein